MATAIDNTYSYSFASGVETLDDRKQVSLATCDKRCEHPYFFQGALVCPHVTAELFLALMDVVRARFHLPAGAYAHLAADPVVTSSESRLRFEAFSACCGLYARVDLTEESVIGETFGHGTTNVDFNAPMMEALRQIREKDPVALSVGKEEVRLSTESGDIVEKKVKLPVRWLKAFVEVQAYQAKMLRSMEIPRVEAVRFLRSVPKIKTHRGRATWLTQSGRSFRWTQVQPRSGVAVGGVERLRILERLTPLAQTLYVYSDDTTGTSAWELHVPGARFTLVMSPETWRGFSGEGQALSDLAGAGRAEALTQIRESLAWDAVIDADRLARTLNLDPDAVRAALAVLGSRGLVGYDLESGDYFHRELPFDLDLVEKLQPRLQNARKLVDSGGVRLVHQDADGIEAYVQGSGVEHRVRHRRGRQREVYVSVVPQASRGPGAV